jgi:hypothetical protein
MIQVIPLNAFGHKQLFSGESIPGAKVCLVTEETKSDDPELMKRT